LYRNIKNKTMGLKYLYAPSGVQAGKAYGVIPNSADADFSSFARSSAGSRVDENGFINTGLGLGSEEVTNGDFDTDSDWTKIDGATISGGEAHIVGDGSVFTNIRQNNVFTVGKAYEITIDVTISSGLGLKFQDGASNENFGFATISGSYTFVSVANDSTLVIGRKTGGTAYDSSVDNVSVREITDVNTNVPRLDYTGGGCPSLLLEPSSTNLIGYSEDFTQSSWTKENNPTIESNVEISPTGSLNGSYLKAPFSATSTSPRIAYFFAATSGQTYTGSVFVKKDNIDYIRLLSTGATASTLQAYYNVSNGTLGSAGSPDKAKIEDYGNGWYRLSLIIDSVNSTSSATFRVQLAKGDNNPASTFDGTEKNIIFGGQLEQQAYATSYIPTYGAASTRSQDVGGSTGDLSNVVNSQEGTFMFEGSFSEQNLKVSLNSSTTTFSNRMSIRTMSDTQFRIDYFAGGVGNQAFFNVSSTKDNAKIAIKWISGSLVVYHNGTEVVDVTNIGDFSPNILNRISLSAADNTSNKFKGRTKQFRVYDEYLSDAEMVKLTTL